MRSSPYPRSKAAQSPVLPRKAHLRLVQVPADGAVIGLSLDVGGRLWTCVEFDEVRGRLRWVTRTGGAREEIITGRSFKPTALGAQVAPKEEPRKPWDFEDRWADAGGLEWVCRHVGKVCWWQHTWFEGLEPCSMWRSSGPTSAPASEPVWDYSDWLDRWSRDIADPAAYISTFIDDIPEGNIFFEHDVCGRWECERAETRPQGHDLLRWRHKDGRVSTTGRCVRAENLLKNAKHPAEDDEGAFEEGFRELAAEFSDGDKPSREDYRFYLRKGHWPWDA